MLSIRLEVLLNLPQKKKKKLYVDVDSASFELLQLQVSFREDGLKENLSVQQLPTINKKKKILHNFLLNLSESKWKSGGRV